MDDAKELIRAGKLSEARALLQGELKSSPGDTAKRTVFFQLLCYLGEWDKAEMHLDLVALQSPAGETGVQLYKNLIAAERVRGEVMAGRARPSLLATAPPYLELFLSARERLLAGNSREAQGIFARIESELSPVSGRVDGEPFSEFANLDPRLSHFLEVFIFDRYLWVPFRSLTELVISAPRTLLDLLWSSASLKTKEGMTTRCYLPVLYPGTASFDDDRVRLGRLTQWQELGEGLYGGVGQHVFQVGEAEKALLEMREVIFAGGEAATP